MVTSLGELTDVLRSAKDKGELDPEAHGVVALIDVSDGGDDDDDDAGGHDGSGFGDEDGDSGEDDDDSNCDQRQQQQHRLIVRSVVLSPEALREVHFLENSGSGGSSSVSGNRDDDHGMGTSPQPNQEGVEAADVPSAPPARRPSEGELEHHQHQHNFHHRQAQQRQQQQSEPQLQFKVEDRVEVENVVKVKNEEVKHASDPAFYFKWVPDLSAHPALAALLLFAFALLAAKAFSLLLFPSIAWLFHPLAFLGSATTTAAAAVVVALWCWFGLVPAWVRRVAAAAASFVWAKPKATGFLLLAICFFFSLYRRRAAAVAEAAVVTELARVIAERDGALQRVAELELELHDIRRSTPTVGTVQVLE
jgi:hypothetical protein